MMKHKMKSKMSHCNADHLCKKAPTGMRSMSAAAQISTTSGQSEGRKTRRAYMSRVGSGY